MQTKWSGGAVHVDIFEIENDTHLHNNTIFDFSLAFHSWYAIYFCEGNKKYQRKKLNQCCVLLVLINHIDIGRRRKRRWRARLSR